MKHFLALVFLGMSVLFFQCKKYPEGPTISLRSKAERLANSWKVQKLLINNVDSTTAFTNVLKDYTVNITKTGSYNTSYYVTIPVFGNISNTESGTWAFSSDKKNVMLTPQSITIGSLPSPSTSQILKLKEKELWTKSTDANGKTTEIHFTPK
jgi:hypothetical protein